MNPLHRNIQAAPTSEPESVRKAREELKKAQLGSHDNGSLPETFSKGEEGTPKSQLSNELKARMAAEEAAPPAPKSIEAGGGTMTKGGDFPNWDAMMPGLSKADPSSYDPNVPMSDEQKASLPFSPESIAAQLQAQGQMEGMFKGRAMTPQETAATRKDNPLMGHMKLATPAGDVEAPRDRAGGDMVAKVRALIAKKKAKKKAQHPVSEAQRRWAFAAEKRGELPKGKARAWSRRAKGQDLPVEKSLDAIDALGLPMSKAGPYIGPRGGKWADAKHTIPWKEGTGAKKTGSPADKEGAAKAPPKQKHHEVHASSQYRHRASAAEKRKYGGSTVTEFYVDDPNEPGGQRFHKYMGYGKTPGHRRTHALQQHAKKHGIEKPIKHTKSPKRYTEKSTGSYDLSKGMEAKMAGKKSKAQRAREHVYSFLGMMTGKQEPTPPPPRTPPLSPRQPKAPPQMPPGGEYPRPGTGRGDATPLQGKQGPDLSLRPRTSSVPSRVRSRQPHQEARPLAEQRQSARQPQPPRTPPPTTGRMTGKQEPGALRPRTARVPERVRSRQPHQEQRPLAEQRQSARQQRPAPPNRGVQPVRRSEEGLELDMRKGGLYSFGDSKHDIAPQALPAKMLPEYLAAFIEEALEHEKRECEHRKLVPQADQDLAEWWAQRIMGELVQYMRKNKDLARAGKNKTFKDIANILRTRGLVMPQTKTATPTDRDSMQAMNAVVDGKVSEVMEYSQVRRGHYTEPFGKSEGLELSLRHTAVAGGTDIVDDKVDPFMAGALTRSTQLARMGNMSKGEFVANVNHDCPVHGFRDLTKSQNLSNPHGHCVCA